MDALAAEYADEYNVTIISNGNCKYNCYSYAWYSQSTSNIYWIDDPLAYPEETLNRMTDEALAQAVADFPLLTDVEVAHSTAYGVEWLAKNSDAYRELLTRSDAKNVLIEQIKKLYDISNMENYIKAIVLKDVVLNERSFQKILTEQEIEYLNSIK